MSLSNQDRLNQMYAAKQVDVKFFVDNAADSSVETLCDEAVHQLEALHAGNLADSAVGGERQPDEKSIG